MIKQEYYYNPQTTQLPASQWIRQGPDVPSLDGVWLHVSTTLVYPLLTSWWIENWAFQSPSRLEPIAVRAGTFFFFFFLFFLSSLIKPQHRSFEFSFSWQLSDFVSSRLVSFDRPTHLPSHIVTSCNGRAFNRYLVPSPSHPLSSWNKTLFAPPPHLASSSLHSSS